MKTFLQSRIMMLLINKEAHICNHCKSVGLFKVVDYKYNFVYGFEFTQEAYCMNCGVINEVPKDWEGILGITKPERE